MIGAHDGKVYDVAPACECIVRWNASDDSPAEFCNKPTTHFYPAHGGGTMPLCQEHAKPHGRHAWPVV